VALLPHLVDLVRTARLAEPVLADLDLDEAAGLLGEPYAGALRSWLATREGETQREELAGLEFALANPHRDADSAHFEPLSRVLAAAWSKYRWYPEETRAAFAAYREHGSDPTFIDPRANPEWPAQAALLDRTMVGLVAPVLLFRTLSESDLLHLGMTDPKQLAFLPGVLVETRFGRAALSPRDLLGTQTRHDAVWLEVEAPEGTPATVVDGPDGDAEVWLRAGTRYALIGVEERLTPAGPKIVARVRVDGVEPYYTQSPGADGLPWRVVDASTPEEPEWPPDEDPPDTSWTSTQMLGAPGTGGVSEPAATAQAIQRALNRRLADFDELDFDPDGTALAVPRGARYALRFRPGPARPGLRGYRSETGETDGAGRPIMDVTVPDSLPEGDLLASGRMTRDYWVARIVAHEPAEEAARVAHQGYVPRIRARIRAAHRGEAAHADALARGADPALTERSPHDEGHRAEVLYLVSEVLTHRDAGHADDVAELTRQLGHLLDEMGIGIPDPADPDAAHSAHRLAVLGLPAVAAEVVEPLLPHDAAWRTYLPPAEWARIRTAVADVLPDLRRLGYALDWRDDRTLTIGLAGGSRHAVDATAMVLALANSGHYGDDLRALALAELGQRLAGALPPELVGPAQADPALGDPVLADPALAAPRLLAHAYTATFGGWRAAAEREFVHRLSGLTAEQAARLSWRLPDAAGALLPHVWRQVATETLVDVIPTVQGLSGRNPVARLLLEPDGNLKVTPHRGRPRMVAPADLMHDLTALVSTGADLPTVRAVAARELGARLGALTRGNRPRWLPRAAARASAAGRYGAMTALARLHLMSEADDATRIAAERAFFALMLRERYWEAPVRQRMADVLPEPAQWLFDRLAERNWASDAAGSYRPPSAPTARPLGRAAAAPEFGGMGPVTEAYRDLLRERDRLDQRTADRAATAERLAAARPWAGAPGTGAAERTELDTLTRELDELDRVLLPEATAAVRAAAGAFESRLDLAIAVHDSERQRLATSVPAGHPEEADRRRTAGEHAEILAPLRAARTAYREAVAGEGPDGDRATTADRFAAVLDRLAEAAAREAEIDAARLAAWARAANVAGPEPLWLRPSQASPPGGRHPAAHLSGTPHPAVTIPAGAPATGPVQVEGRAAGHRRRSELDQAPGHIQAAADAVLAAMRQMDWVDVGDEFVLVKTARGRLIPMKILLHRLTEPTGISVRVADGGPGAPGVTEVHLDFDRIARNFDDQPDLERVAGAVVTNALGYAVARHQRAVGPGRHLRPVTTTHPAFTDREVPKRALRLTPARLRTTAQDAARVEQLRWEVSQHLKLEDLIAQAGARVGGEVPGAGPVTRAAELPVWEAGLRELLAERGRSQQRIARLLHRSGAIAVPRRYRLVPRRYRLLERLVTRPRTADARLVRTTLRAVRDAELRRARWQADRPFGPVPAEFASGPAPARAPVPDEAAAPTGPVTAPPVPPAMPPAPVRPARAAAAPAAAADPARMQAALRTVDGVLEFLRTDDPADGPVRDATRHGAGTVQVQAHRDGREYRVPVLDIVERLAEIPDETARWIEAGERLGRRVDTALEVHADPAVGALSLLIALEATVPDTAPQVRAAIGERVFQLGDELGLLEVRPIPVIEPDELPGPVRERMERIERGFRAPQRFHSRGWVAAGSVVPVAVAAHQVGAAVTTWAVPALRDAGLISAGWLADPRTFVAVGPDGEELRVPLPRINPARLGPDRARLPSLVVEALAAEVTGHLPGEEAHHPVEQFRALARLHELTTGQVREETEARLRRLIKSYPLTFWSDPQRVALTGYPQHLFQRLAVPPQELELPGGPDPERLRWFATAERALRVLGPDGVGLVPHAEVQPDGRMWVPLSGPLGVSVPIPTFVLPARTGDPVDQVREVAAALPALGGELAAALAPQAGIFPPTGRPLSADHRRDLPAIGELYGAAAAWRLLAGEQARLARVVEDLERATRLAADAAGDPALAGAAARDARIEADRARERWQAELARLRTIDAELAGADAGLAATAHDLGLLLRPNGYVGNLAAYDLVSTDLRAMLARIDRQRGMAAARPLGSVPDRTSATIDRIAATLGGPGLAEGEERILRSALRVLPVIQGRDVRLALTDRAELHVTSATGRFRRERTIPLLHQLPDPATLPADDRAALDAAVAGWLGGLVERELSAARRPETRWLYRALDTRLVEWLPGLLRQYRPDYRRLVPGRASRLRTGMLSGEDWVHLGHLVASARAHDQVDEETRRHLAARLTDPTLVDPRVRRRALGILGNRLTERQLALVADRNQPDELWGPGARAVEDQLRDGLRGLSIKAQARLPLDVDAAFDVADVHQATDLDVPRIHEHEYRIRPRLGRRDIRMNHNKVDRDMWVKVAPGADLPPGQLLRLTRVPFKSLGDRVVRRHFLVQGYYLLEVADRAADLPPEYLKKQLVKLVEQRLSELHTRRPNMVARPSEIVLQAAAVTAPVGLGALAGAWLFGVPVTSVLRLVVASFGAALAIGPARSNFMMRVVRNVNLRLQEQWGQFYRRATADDLVDGYERINAERDQAGLAPLRAVQIPPRPPEGVDPDVAERLRARLAGRPAGDWTAAGQHVQRVERLPGEEAVLRVHLDRTGGRPRPVTTRPDGAGPVARRRFGPRAPSAPPVPRWLADPARRAMAPVAWLRDRSDPRHFDATFTVHHRNRRGVPPEAYVSTQEAVDRYDVWLYPAGVYGVEIRLPQELADAPPEVFDAIMRKALEAAAAYKNELLDRFHLPESEWRKAGLRMAVGGVPLAGLTWWLSGHSTRLAMVLLGAVGAGQLVTALGGGRYIELRYGDPDDRFGTHGLQEDTEMPDPGVVGDLAETVRDGHEETIRRINTAIDTVSGILGRPPARPSTGVEDNLRIATQAIVEGIAEEFGFQEGGRVARLARWGLRKTPVVDIWRVNPEDPADIEKLNQPPWKIRRDPQAPPYEPSADDARQVIVVDVWQREGFGGRYSRAVLVGDQVHDFRGPEGIQLMTEAPTGKVYEVSTTAAPGKVLGSVPWATKELHNQFTAENRRRYSEYLKEKGFSTALIQSITQGVAAWFGGVRAKELPSHTNPAGAAGGLASALADGAANEYHQDHKFAKHQLQAEDLDPGNMQVRPATLMARQEVGERALDTLQAVLADGFRDLGDHPYLPDDLREQALAALDQLATQPFDDVMRAVNAFLENIGRATRPDDPYTSIGDRLGIADVRRDGQHHYRIQFSTDRFGMTPGLRQIGQRRVAQALVRFESAHDLDLADPVQVRRIEDRYVVLVNPAADTERILHGVALVLVYLGVVQTSIVPHVPFIPVYVVNRLINVSGVMLAALLLGPAATLLEFLAPVTLAALHSAIMGALSDEHIQIHREQVLERLANFAPVPHPDLLTEYQREVADQTRRFAQLQGMIHRLRELRGRARDSLGAPVRSRTEGPAQWLLTRHGLVGAADPPVYWPELRHPGMRIVDRAGMLLPENAGPTGPGALGGPARSAGAWRAATVFAEAVARVLDPTDPTTDIGAYVAQVTGGRYEPYRAPLGTLASGLPERSIAYVAAARPGQETRHFAVVNWEGRIEVVDPPGTVPPQETVGLTALDRLLAPYPPDTELTVLRDDSPAPGGPAGLGPGGTPPHPPAPVTPTASPPGPAAPTTPRPSLPDTAALHERLTRLIDPAAPASTAARVAEFFDGLNRAEANQLGRDHPELVGNLDGVPPRLRYAVNDQRAADWLADLWPRLSAGGASRTERAMAESLHRLRSMDGRILSLSFEGTGRIVHVDGDLASARNVVVYVPPAGAAGLAGAAGQVGLAQGLRAGPDGSDTAVVTFGYEPPPGPLAASVRAVLPIADQLGALRSELHPHLRPDALTTVVGRGFVGTTVATRAVRAGARFDQVVLLGSPGLGPRVAAVADLGLPAGVRVFAARDRADRLAATGWYGPDPAEFPDLVRLSTDGAGPGGDLYLAPGSGALDNVTRVVRGQAQDVSRAPRGAGDDDGRIGDDGRVGRVLRRAAGPLGRAQAAAEGAPAGPAGPATREPLPPEFTAVLDGVLPRLRAWYRALDREGDALVAVTRAGHRLQVDPPVPDPAGFATPDAYERAVARAALFTLAEADTAAVRPSRPGFLGALSRRPAAMTAHPAPSRRLSLGWDDLPYRQEFEFLAAEHDRLGRRIDAELSARRLRRDPATDAVYSRGPDGGDHLALLAAASTMAGLRPDTDLRAEVERRAGGRFEMVREGLDRIAPDRARDVLAGTVERLVRQLRSAPAGHAAYLLVTGADGRQVGYGLVRRPGGEVAALDPRTGRDEPVNPDTDARAVDAFLDAAPAPRSIEVLHLDDTAVPWRDPLIPVAVRELRAQRQAVEAEAHQLARRLAMGFGPGDERRIGAFSRGMDESGRAFVRLAAAPRGPREKLLAEVYRTLLSGDLDLSLRPLTEAPITPDDVTPRTQDRLDLPTPDGDVFTGAFEAAPYLRAGVGRARIRLRGAGLTFHVELTDPGDGQLARFELVTPSSGRLLIDPAAPLAEVPAAVTAALTGAVAARRFGISGLTSHFARNAAFGIGGAAGGLLAAWHDHGLALAYLTLIRSGLQVGLRWPWSFALYRDRYGAKAELQRHQTRAAGQVTRADLDRTVDELFDAVGMPEAAVAERGTAPAPVPWTGELRAEARRRLDAVADRIVDDGVVGIRRAERHGTQLHLDGGLGRRPVRLAVELVPSATTASQLWTRGMVEPGERVAYRVDVGATMVDGRIDWAAFEQEAMEQIRAAVDDRRTFFNQLPGVVAHLVRRGLLAPPAAAGTWAFATYALHQPGLGKVLAASIVGSYLAGGWARYRGHRQDFAQRQAEKDDRRAALGLPRTRELGRNATGVAAVAAELAGRADAVRSRLAAVDPSAVALDGGAPVPPDDTERHAVDTLLELDGTTADIGVDRYAVQARRSGPAAVTLTLRPPGGVRIPRRIEVTVARRELRGAAAVPRRTGLASFELQVSAEGGNRDALVEAVRISARDIVANQARFGPRELSASVKYMLGRYLPQLLVRGATMYAEGAQHTATGEFMTAGNAGSGVSDHLYWRRYWRARFGELSRRFQPDRHTPPNEPLRALADLRDRVETIERELAGSLERAAARPDAGPAPAALLAELRAAGHRPHDEVVAPIRALIEDPDGPLTRIPGVGSITPVGEGGYAVEFRAGSSAVQRWWRGWHLPPMRFRVTSGEVEGGAVAAITFGDDTDAVIVVDNRAGEAAVREFPALFAKAVRLVIFAGTRPRMVGPFARYSATGQVAGLGVTVLGAVFPGLSGHLAGGTGELWRLPPAALARGIKVLSDGLVQPWNLQDKADSGRTARRVHARFGGVPSGGRIGFVSRQIAALDARLERLADLIGRYEPPAGPPAQPDRQISDGSSAGPAPLPYRPAAELPEQLRRAARQPGLAHLKGYADRLDALVVQARRDGDITPLVTAVRETSAAVAEHADRLPGINPLDDAVMAGRPAGIDPVTHQFHVLDQAIITAKIGDVLGAEFERHAVRTWRFVVPKDPESARALLPPGKYTRTLDAWIRNPVHEGTVDWRLGVVFVAAQQALPRSLTAVAATLVHEGVHLLQPDTRPLDAAIVRRLAGGAPSGVTRHRVLAYARFEREFEAFVVEQAFLRGLSALPPGPGLRYRARMTPEQLESYILNGYLKGSAEFGRKSLDKLLGDRRDFLARFRELRPEPVLVRLRAAADAFPGVVPGPEPPRWGPVTRTIAQTFGVPEPGLRPAAAGWFGRPGGSPAEGRWEGLNPDLPPGSDQPDVLRPDGPLTAQELSSRDVERLEEVEALSRAATDDRVAFEERIEAKARLDRLLGDLGLHPGPGAGVRYGLVDPRLSDTARTVVQDIANGHSRVQLLFSDVRARAALDEARDIFLQVDGQLVSLRDALVDKLTHELPLHPQMLAMLETHDTPGLAPVDRTVEQSVAHALWSRPRTLHSVLSSRTAISIIVDSVHTVHHRGADAIASEPHAVPAPTPLTDGQQAISRQVRDAVRDLERVAGEHVAHQPGFAIDLATVSSVRDDPAINQYLDRLIGQSEEAKPSLYRLTSALAEATGGRAIIRPFPKDRGRALDKIVKYEGEAYRLNDLAATAVQYTRLEDLYEALSVLLRLAKEHGVLVVSFEDRFHTPQPSGYRDVKLALRLPNGHIGELRLHLTAIDDVASYEHNVYQAWRDVRAVAMSEGREMTHRELAYVETIRRELQSRFWVALQRAL